jgi:hypothetical protein
VAIQSIFYNTDGSTRTFPSTKHIPTKQHCVVYKKKVSDSLWIVANTDDYSLVNNSIIFIAAPDQAVYSQVEIRVADAQDELATSPSDIAIVAGIASQVSAVAAIDDEVVIVANNIASIVINANNIVDINTVADDISNVDIVANQIASGGIIGGQFLGTEVIKGVQYMSQSTYEILNVPVDTNAFSVGSFTIESGGTINVPSGSLYKIL